MTTNITYKDLNRIKKRHQVAFRRWMQFKSEAIEVSQYVGISLEKTRDWISSQWIDGMSWENYGSIWVIDHIVPLRLFDVLKNDDLGLAWNYHNLMPLLKKDNLHKEGDLGFSLMKLESLEDCYHVQCLKRKAESEIAYMSRYLNIVPKIIPELIV